MRISIRSKNNDLVKFGDRFQQQSNLFKTSLIPLGEKEEFYAPKLSTDVLLAIKAWSDHHSKDVKPRSSFDGKLTDVKGWDLDFIRRHRDLLADITEAANYLEILSLLDLCCRKASRYLDEERILKLPQELQDIIRAHELIEDVKSRDIVEAYIFRGGIRSERRAKVREIEGKHKGPQTLSNETRDGIYWCERGKVPDMNMGRLSEIMKAGKLIQNPHFSVISLPTCSRPDLVSCSVTDETTHIAIHSTGIGPHNWLSGQWLNADAKRALKGELERVLTRNCTITWPKGSKDELQEYRIPKTIKVLKVQGLKSAFCGKDIPSRWGPAEDKFGEYEDPSHPNKNRYHWIHELIKKFKSLDELEFESYISPADLTNLGEWLESTKVLRTR